MEVKRRPSGGQKEVKLRSNRGDGASGAPNERRAGGDRRRPSEQTPGCNVAVKRRRQNHGHITVTWRKAAGAE